MPASMQRSRSSVMTFADRAMIGSRPAAAAAFVLANLPGRGEPVHDRHLAVHQHGVEGGFGQALEGLGAVVGDGDLGGQPLQHALRHALIHGIVLDQQDLAAVEGRDRGAGRRAPQHELPLAAQHLVEDPHELRHPDGLGGDRVRTMRPIVDVVIGPVGVK